MTQSFGLDFRGWRRILARAEAADGAPTAERRAPGAQSPRSAASGSGGRSGIGGDAASNPDDGLRQPERFVIAEVISRIAFLVLVVLLVPVGLLVIIASLALGALVSAVLHPVGVLASAIGVIWIVGTLAAMFFSFRILYRRMPNRLRSAYSAPMETARREDRIVAEPPRAPTRRGRRGSAKPGVPPLTLAELDARLAPGPPAGPS